MRGLRPVGSGVVFAAAGQGHGYQSEALHGQPLNAPGAADATLLLARRLPGPAGVQA
jgi:hypothetical protein